MTTQIRTFDSAADEAFDEDVYCVLVQTRSPDHPAILTAGWTYVRFHGPDARRHPYAGRYGSRRLARRSPHGGDNTA